MLCRTWLSICVYGLSGIFWKPFQIARASGSVIPTETQRSESFDHGTQSALSGSMITYAYHHFAHHKGPKAEESRKETIDIIATSKKDKKTSQKKEERTVRNISANYGLDHQKFKRDDSEHVYARSISRGKQLVRVRAGDIDINDLIINDGGVRPRDLNPKISDAGGKTFMISKHAQDFLEKIRRAYLFHYENVRNYKLRELTYRRKKIGEIIKSVADKHLVLPYFFPTSLNDFTQASVEKVLLEAWKYQSYKGVQPLRYITIEQVPDKDTIEVLKAIIATSNKVSEHGYLLQNTPNPNDQWFALLGTPIIEFIGKSLLRDSSAIKNAWIQKIIFDITENPQGGSVSFFIELDPSAVEGSEVIIDVTQRTDRTKMIITAIGELKITTMLQGRPKAVTYRKTSVDITSPKGRNDPEHPAKVYEFRSRGDTGHLIFVSPFATDINFSSSQIRTTWKIAQDVWEFREGSARLKMITFASVPITEDAYLGQLKFTDGESSVMFGERDPDLKPFLRKSSIGRRFDSAGWPDRYKPRGPDGDFLKVVRVKITHHPVETQANEDSEKIYRVTLQLSQVQNPGDIPSSANIEGDDIALAANIEDDGIASPENSGDEGVGTIEIEDVPPATLGHQQREESLEDQYEAVIDDDFAQTQSQGGMKKNQLTSFKILETCVRGAENRAWLLMTNLRSPPPPSELDTKSIENQFRIFEKQPYPYDQIDKTLDSDAQILYSEVSLLQDRSPEGHKPIIDLAFGRLRNPSWEYFSTESKRYPDLKLTFHLSKEPGAIIIGFDQIFTLDTKATISFGDAAFLACQKLGSGGYSPTDKMQGLDGVHMIKFRVLTEETRSILETIFEIYGFSPPMMFEHEMVILEQQRGAASDRLARQTQLRVTHIMYGLSEVRSIDHMLNEYLEFFGQRRITGIFLSGKIVEGKWQNPGLLMIIKEYPLDKAMPRSKVQAAYGTYLTANQEFLAAAMQGEIEFMLQYSRLGPDRVFSPGHGFAGQSRVRPWGENPENDKLSDKATLYREIALVQNQGQSTSRDEYRNLLFEFDSVKQYFSIASNGEHMVVFDIPAIYAQTNGYKATVALLSDFYFALWYRLKSSSQRDSENLLQIQPLNAITITKPSVSTARLISTIFLYKQSSRKAQAGIKITYMELQLNDLFDDNGVVKDTNNFDAAVWILLISTPEIRAVLQMARNFPRETVYRRLVSIYIKERPQNAFWEAISSQKKFEVLLLLDKYPGAPDEF